MNDLAKETNFLVGLFSLVGSGLGLRRQGGVSVVEVDVVALLPAQSHFSSSVPVLVSQIRGTQNLRLFPCFTPRLSLPYHY